MELGLERERRERKKGAHECVDVAVRSLRFFFGGESEDGDRRQVEYCEGWVDEEDVADGEAELLEWTSSHEAEDAGGEFDGTDPVLGVRSKQVGESRESEGFEGDLLGFVAFLLREKG